MIFDPIYFLFIGPALLLSLWASLRTKSAFRKYSRVPTRSGLSGAEAAHRLLEGAGIDDVQIVPTRGLLSDHYNPVSKKLALSESVYASKSVAAIGVACHEAGHAIQHAKHYAPLAIRSALVPTAKIGSSVGIWTMVFGAIFSASGLITIGAILFSAVLAFQVVTLPVEFDASARAEKLAVSSGIVTAEERVGMDRVLNAAALTYVAAAISTLMTLLYFLMRRD